MLCYVIDRFQYLNSIIVSSSVIDRFQYLNSIIVRAFVEIPGSVHRFVTNEINIIMALISL